MRSTIIKLTLSLAVLGYCNTALAQGFLKKLTSAVTETATEQTDTTTVKDRIKESDIPSYSCQKVYETDDQGNRLKNEDGTDKYRVFLVDKEGKKVSPEAVAAQNKQINQAILKIAAKVGISAGIGTLSGGGKGALIGIATGLGLSVNDIILCVKLKKQSNKQKKAIEAYRKSFDEEGNPIAAEIDKKTLKELDLNEDNSLTESTTKIKEELSRPEYDQTPTNESIDALLDAATKA